MAAAGGSMPAARRRGQTGSVEGLLHAGVQADVAGVEQHDALE